MAYTSQDYRQDIETQSVIGFPITALPLKGYIDYITYWASLNLSKIVCVANVHMLVEATKSSSLASVLGNADLVTPDGMPLVWMIRFLHRSQQERATGMDLLEGTCKVASERAIAVFFIGSEPRVLTRMRVRLEREFPQLIIGGMESLPFGELPLPQVAESPVLEKIKASRAGVVFVSLGCPKQEKWMAQHQGEIQAVMVGIGGVFPIYAGLHKHAPKFIRESGFEWLYRLFQEPQRLWKRYAETIPPFLLMAASQVWHDRNRRVSKSVKPRPAVRLR